MAITPGGRVGDASPTGHKGGKRQLSDYERELWHALRRRGVPEKKAYRMARGILRNALGGKWGRGRIRNPAVQAGAYASMAQRAAIKGGHSLSEPDVHGKLRKHYPPETVEWARGMHWTRRRVPLSAIQMESRPGKPHDPAKVAAIRKSIRRGKKLKPVVLVDNGGERLKIADGYHRTAAVRAEGGCLAEAYVGKTRKRTGPWSRSMHTSKLNV